MYQDSPADAEFSARSWPLKLKSGLARRIRRQLRVWRGPQGFPVEQALAALACCRWQQAEIATSADDLQAALDFCQWDAADRLAVGFLNGTTTSGAVVDGAGRPSLLQTGEAIRGWQAWFGAANKGRAHVAASGSRGSTGKTETALAQAASWLAGHVTASGELAMDSQLSARDRFSPRSLHLRWAATLRDLATEWGEANWKEAADRMIACWRRQVDFCHWRGPLHEVAPGWLALIELDETSLARQALWRPRSLQQKDGSVPAVAGVAGEAEGRWVSLPGLAQLARAWFLVGDVEPATRAMAWLTRQQRDDGHWPGSVGPDACYHASEACLSASTQYLLSAQAQVAAAFQGGDDFPAEIQADDGRWLAVLEWARQLPRGAKVVDVGCGRGRYLKRLRQVLPHLQLIGIDLCEQHVQRLPQGVEGRQGSLLHLPAAAGEFDAALAVEAIEHSLAPRLALNELCRVVRPGGSVLVIDKNRRQQALSEHASWECWLDVDETKQWLAADCSQVSATAIAHGPNQEPSGLFWAWTANRAHAKTARAA